MPLSATAQEQIDKEIRKYPAEQKQSAVMSALRIVQAEKGWLQATDIAAVAEYLDMPAIAVHEVATFYNMYYLNKVGKHVLTICTNLPCALSGGQDAADYLRKKLNINFGETTPDGLFTLREGECMGACGDAPVLLHNNHKMCSFMDNQTIDALIAEMSASADTSTN